MYWAEADFEKEGQRAGQKNRTQTGENHCMGGGGGGVRTVQLVWPS